MSCHLELSWMGPVLRVATRFRVNYVLGVEPVPEPPHEPNVVPRMVPQQAIDPRSSTGGKIRLHLSPVGLRPGICLNDLASG